MTESHCEECCPEKKKHPHQWIARIVVEAMVWTLGTTLAAVILKLVLGW
jgi:hypothetical protein